MQIEVKNLCVAYEGTEMVHDVSFSLGEGEVLSIVGESGSGKTTVIRAMIGCLPSVGKVTGGQILFGFNATDSAFEVVPQVFVWNLSSSDNIAVIQHNFLDLMAECRVEHIRILHDVLPENADLPTYAQSLSLDGHNPFFSEHA